MLTVEHLTFSYSRRSAPVLRDAALTLRDGEIGILLGRNGSGKTTLFRNLLGICTPDSGSIRFDGQELTALPRRQRARCIAYVPQDIRFGDLTVFDSVLLGRLSRFGLQAGPADRAAAAQVLADMALSPLADRRVTELSGGERQALAIGRAMYFGARLVILDEPTTALSLKEVKRVLEFIQALRDKGRSVLLVSHHVHQAYDVADRFLFMDKGRTVGEVRREGTSPADLTERLLSLAEGRGA